MVNVDRLDSVLTAIEKSEASGGRRLWMATFRSDGDSLTPECGTSACLAGWTALTAPGVSWLDPYSIMVRDSAHDMDETVSAFARRWLELTESESEAIFYAFGVESLTHLKAHIRTVLADPNVYHGDGEDEETYDTQED